MVPRKVSSNSEPAPKTKWKFSSSVDDNYVWPLIVATHTMLKNGDPNVVHIEIGYENSSLSKDSINVLKKFFGIHQVSYNFMEVNLEYPLIESEYLTVNTFARLSLADLTKEPFFWFDADLLFLKSWMEVLHEIEPVNEKFMVQGVVDPLAFQKNTEISKNAAVSVSPNSYVNAGFVYINSPVWRSSGASGTWKSLLEPYTYSSKGFMFHDQCILNFLAGDKKKLISPQFNYLVRSDNQRLSKEVKIAHFAGSYKPWNSSLSALFIFAPFHNRKLYRQYIYAQVQLVFWVFMRNPRFARELEKLRRMQIKHEQLDVIIKKKVKFVFIPRIKNLLKM